MLGPQSRDCQRGQKGFWTLGGLGLEGRPTRWGTEVLRARDSENAPGLQALPVPGLRAQTSRAAPSSWPVPHSVSGEGGWAGCSQEGTRLWVRRWPGKPEPDGRERLTSLEEVKFTLQVVEHLHCQLETGPKRKESLYSTARGQCPCAAAKACVHMCARTHTYQLHVSAPT